jgi:predicted transcriptional regulator
MRRSHGRGDSRASISVTLDLGVILRLDAYADDTGQTRSRVAEDALLAFLPFDSDLSASGETHSDDA